jgi:hypothetical protein
MSGHCERCRKFGADKDLCLLCLNCRDELREQGKLAGKKELAIEIINYDDSYFMRKRDIIERLKSQLSRGSQKEEAKK